jgi:ABC-type transport system involved in cytochrome c biogenesis permease subunit
LGIALLIPGTILGGVWAAESWGRFWDWDPKESWAFISSCAYLIIIHSYTFGHIRGFGLAVGSIVGLLFISFTWYGVNYVLGTGLHSYGFGTGGEFWYYGFILAEALFLIWKCFSGNRVVQ